jgi:hypothetical protein
VSEYSEHVLHIGRLQQLFLSTRKPVCKVRKDPKELFEIKAASHTGPKSDQKQCKSPGMDHGDSVAG